jgi:hypothetical protein
LSCGSLLDCETLKMTLDGYMMHGVQEVVIFDRHRHLEHIQCKRVYQWSSGALTIYVEDEPWKWIPPYRVYEIIGGESG